MFSKQTISLFIIAFIGFIDFIGIGLVYPMFSSMLYSSNCLFLSDTTSDAMRGTCLGILLAMMPITQFFSAPLLGILSDQYGRKKILIPSLAVGLIGYLIAIFAVIQGNLILLLLSRVGVGIAGGTAAVVNAALADISSNEDKAKNFGLLNMAMGLGFTLGPLIGGLSSEMHIGFIQGYSVAFLGAAGLIFINLFLVIFFFEESYTPKIASKLSILQGIENIKKALISKQLRFLFGCVFFACVGWSFYWEFIPVVWIKDFGFDQKAVGYNFAYGALFYAVSCGLLIRPIVSRFSNYYVLFWGLVGCSLSIGMLLIHSNPFGLWFYIPIQQFCIALFWPTAAAAVSNSVNEEQQGETLGILQSVESLAFAISPLIAGPLLGISISMPIFIGSGMILLAALILSLSFNQKETSQVKIRINE
ncbi:MAG: MFS transporter [Parachlamydiaceae bacterium]|nr:MFS transporter [Parachlamydiaceae bacterium]